MASGLGKKNIDFGKGNMLSIILKQAVPLTASQLASLLYNIIDRIYIGHIKDVGFDSLTGLGLSLPIITIISAFTLLFGHGGSPVFSMARGAGDKEKAAKVLGNSFISLLFSSVILTIAGYVFMKPLVYALGGSDVTYPYAKAYLSIYLIGTIMVMLSTGMNFYISAQGYPGMAMVTTLSGAVINIALDPIFIFALNQGIRGAAIATVISQAISFIWVMFFLTKSKAEFKINPKYLHLDANIIKEIISIGFTGFVMEFTNSATQIVCNIQLRNYGGDLYVGIMTIVNSVRAIMAVAVNGITSGAQPVIGFNYGAKKFDRVKSGIKCSSFLAFAYTALAWLVVFIFPNFFIKLFSDDTSMNLVAVKYLHIYFMAYVFMSLQHSGQSTFMALGKAKRAIFFSMFRKIILVVPLTLILPLFLTDAVSGIFWAEPISNIVGGAASFFTMYFTLYRKLGKE